MKKMKEKCIVCDVINWEIYCSIESEKYEVLICKECSLTKLSPSPTEEELNNFYAKEYRDKFSNQMDVPEEVVAYEQLRANRVISVISEYFNEDYKNILDIGCSSGTLLKNIKKISTDIVPHGIEMNDNYRKYIIENNIVENNNISNEDINTYYINKEGMFDFISIVHVLEHLRTPKKTLQSINKLLTDKGKLYIEVPNLKTPYNNLRSNYFAIYHLYYFSEYSLRKLLENTGFRILKEEQIAGTSICFVCEKEDTFALQNTYNKDEYFKLLNILKRYEKKYPIVKFKMNIIKILDLLGLKEFIKSILKK